ncbi:(3R)-hydroxymyristoyl ACP dehydratase [Candidatus Ishikawaella capsulata Mpkobe]|uniref:(3R)-hydroxymyristoyl ACP dehydratase n=1 Tax=Candidatus Ishikawaella capsulata Mpkobe TaxID=476281 RepID=C5WCK1_9ENTR|nr:(3R)-hydroxymyristoyl ACP dehydratase [Candidatus Ishikawaella capsulata Mpkobe]
MILESIAQASSILLYKNSRKFKKKETYYLASIDYVRFRYPVVPGDQLIIEVTCEKKILNFTKFKGIITVNNKIVCEAKITGVISPDN